LTAGADGAPFSPFGRHVRRAWTARAAPVAAVRALAEGLGAGPFALIVLFVSPDRDRAALTAALAADPAFAAAPVIGCTTAGEITGDGYADGAMVAIALPSADFAAALRLVAPLENYTLGRGREVVHGLKLALAGAPETLPNEFALMLTDGLAMREDALVSSLGPALGTTPLLGGSAADALDFSATPVLHGGRFHTDAAVIALVRTRLRVKVFRFDNFTPTDTRMVVTSADPENRIVHEINAEPAAREYARMIGKNPDQLTPLTFASNPVVVKAGGQHHVRSIQRIEETGDLRFFSAIDEGLVLTVAEARDIAEHLDEALSSLSSGGAPDTVIGFDCALRRVEVEQTQALGKVSEILRRHGVIGFNTYGEQHNTLHVNQTFTGVALYAPEDVDG
jgi:hypothetical protein